MKWPGLVIAAAVVVGVAAPSSAGQVKLEIRDGLVSLEARDATLREILDEWARVGQTRVVNAEKVPVASVTLQLTDVPERQALETLLRSAAGFVAAPRQVQQASLSTYDRIVLMPGIRPAVVPTTATRAPASQLPGIRDRVVPAPMPAADDEDEPGQLQAPPNAAVPPGQRPGMPFVNPYMPASGAQPASVAPAQPEAPASSAQRPGMPTAPAQPIKK